MTNANRKTATAHQIETAHTAHTDHSTAWEQYTVTADLYERACNTLAHYKNTVPAIMEREQLAKDDPTTDKDTLKALHTATMTALRNLRDAQAKADYLRKCYDKAKADLLRTEKQMLRTADKLKDKDVPITAVNLYDRSAMVAFVALRTAEQGSKIKRNEDGETVGGGNTGASRQVMRTKSMSAYALTNAETETAYLERSCNDFDDIRQEVALALWDGMTEELDTEELYRTAFSTAHKWIYANRVRPASKHQYIIGAGDMQHGFDIVDTTADFAHMVNHIDQYDHLKAIKDACTAKQWEVIVLVGKGNSTKQIAARMGMADTAVRKLLERGRANARRLFPTIADFSLFIEDTAQVSAYLLAYAD